MEAVLVYFLLGAALAAVGVVQVFSALKTD